MALYSWTNTQRYLESIAPVIAKKYEELGNLSNPVSYEIGELQITVHLPSYAQYIEYGRGPGRFPPIEAIQNWMTAKHIVPREDRTVPQVSYLIARKIAREGTQGKHAAEGTIDFVKNTFLPQLYSAIVQDVKSNLKFK